MNKTLLLKNKPEDIQKASVGLRDGKTVVFPTETVYGLGANALDGDAAKKIYVAKGRPSDNPLILHIAKLDWVNKLATEIPECFYPLAESFWPGPLTLVLKANLSVIPKETIGGLETVAVRMPGHPLALELLYACDLPIAAPSANTSGRPSPTNLQHVIEDMYGKVDIILDGGDTPIGIESTVLDLSRGKPKILRPGSVTQEELEEVIEVEGFEEQIKGPILSPGIKYRHYQPKAPMKVILGNDSKVLEEIKRRIPFLRSSYNKIGVLCYEEDLAKITKSYDNVFVVSMGSKFDLKEVAINLYKCLRQFDTYDVDYILGRGISNPKGVGIAIANRLNKACGNNIEII